jgi:hypothetical protein
MRAQRQQLVAGGGPFGNDVTRHASDPRASGMPTRSTQFSQWFRGSRRNVARRARENFRWRGIFARPKRKRPCERRGGLCRSPDRRFGASEEPRKHRASVPTRDTSCAP